MATQLAALESELRQRFAKTSDIRFRPLRVAGREGLLLFLDSMVDRDQINRDVIGPLRALESAVAARDLLLAINVGGAAELQPDPAQSEKAVLDGDAVIIVDGVGLIRATVERQEHRSVDVPVVEKTTRGARDSFTEQLRTNLGLIRPRLKDPRLRVEQITVGARSQTACALVYLEDVADKAILQVVRDRLKAIEVDGPMGDAHLQEYLVDNVWSPFPQLRVTERPDWVTWEVLQGKVAILVDGSATALLGPSTLLDFYRSPEDYQHGTWESIYVRLGLRLVAFIFSLYLPALYVALTDVTPELLPTKLALSIAGSREGVPFPALVEVLFMEVGLELLREAPIRMPRMLGPTIGIVGGLVLGQAAVGARIVSDIMIIVIALTAMAQYVPPSQEISVAWRTLRWFFTISAGLLGMYGLALMTFLMLFHMAGMHSLGVPYLTALGTPHRSLIIDGIVRMPFARFIRRPKRNHPQDEQRALPYQQPHHNPDLERMRHEP
ncbi:MAG TPA: spore germination protein [Symbiobacteriaceae bacterium]|nr:spore germination protein [Symbiobacteriaceae bacterium]